MIIRNYDDVDGCAMAFDVTDGLTLSGTTLTKWESQVGSAAFVVPTDDFADAVGPRLETRSVVMGGNPAVEWGVGNTVLRYIPIPLFAPTTLFFCGCATGSILRTDNGGVTRIILDGRPALGPSTGWIVLRSAPFAQGSSVGPTEVAASMHRDAFTITFNVASLTLGTAAGREQGIFPGPATQPFVCWASISTDGSVEYGRNGRRVKRTSIAAGLIEPCVRMYLGRVAPHSLRPSPEGNWLGVLSGFAVYERALDLSEKRALSELMADRCGVTWLAMSAHNRYGNHEPYGVLRR